MDETEFREKTLSAKTTNTVISILRDKKLNS